MSTVNIIEMVHIEDSFCQYRLMEYTAMWKKAREEQKLTYIKDGHDNNYGLICPICNHEFQVGQQTYMLITNNSTKLFPNCVIHQNCCNGEFKDTTIRLKARYNRYKQLLEDYRSWL